MFRSSLSQTPRIPQQPAAPCDDALRAARSARLAERARQARAAAWLCLYHADECNDEATAAMWQAERETLLAEAARLEADGAR